MTCLSSWWGHACLSLTLVQVVDGRELREVFFCCGTSWLGLPARTAGRVLRRGPRLGGEERSERSGSSERSERSGRSGRSTGADGRQGRGGKGPRRGQGTRVALPGAREGGGGVRGTRGPVDRPRCAICNDKLGCPVWAKIRFQVRRKREGGGHGN